VTRDSVIRLAQDLDIPVVETIVPREMLYIADEVFFTGRRRRSRPFALLTALPSDKAIAARLPRDCRESFLP